MGKCCCWDYNPNSGPSYPLPLGNRGDPLLDEMLQLLHRAISAEKKSVARIQNDGEGRKNKKIESKKRYNKAFSCTEVCSLACFKFSSSIDDFSVSSYLS